MEKIKRYIFIITSILISCKNNSLNQRNKIYVQEKNYEGNIIQINYTKNLHETYMDSNDLLKNYFLIREEYLDNIENNIIVCDGFIDFSKFSYFNIDIEQFKELKNIYLPKLGDTLVIYSKKNKFCMMVVDKLDLCEKINKEELEKLNVSMNCDFGYIAIRVKLLNYLEDVNADDTLIDLIFKYNKNQNFKYLGNYMKTPSLKFNLDQNIEIDLNNMRWNSKNGISYPINKIEAFRINDEEFFIIEREDDEFLYKEVYKVIEEGKLKLIYEYPQA
ncbi:MAG: hypothetical protein KatS3mg028_1484 [Bacteroidia bacterium]|nr:MAG: hypothetical protein KatS3mg028_1484 [Bacteroidia bacterium]